MLQVGCKFNLKIIRFLLCPPVLQTTEQHLYSPHNGSCRLYGAHVTSLSGSLTTTSCALTRKRISGPQPARDAGTGWKHACQVAAPHLSGSADHQKPSAIRIAKQKVKWTVEYRSDAAARICRESRLTFCERNILFGRWRTPQGGLRLDYPSLFSFSKRISAVFKVRSRTGGAGLPFQPVFIRQLTLSLCLLCTSHNMIHVTAL